MVEYLKNYIRKIQTENNLAREWIVTVKTELERFDPRDFEPSVQHEIVWHRVRLHYLGESQRLDKGTFGPFFDGLLAVLDRYRGEGSRGVARTFPYVKDKALREIVERDYIELTVRVFPSGAWKSTVIMAGSILEAILFDLLSDPKRVAQTNASSKGAKAKGGVPIDILTGADYWKLSQLINVAVDIGILSAERAATIDQVLRDYRNFVHPQRELKAKHECSESEAGLAKYGLDGVCDHLAKTLTETGGPSEISSAASN